MLRNSLSSIAFFICINRSAISNSCLDMIGRSRCSFSSSMRLWILTNRSSPLYLLRKALLRRFISRIFFITVSIYSMASFASWVLLGEKPCSRKYLRNSSARITYLSSLWSKFDSNSRCTFSALSRRSFTTIRNSSDIPFLNSNSRASRATLMIPDTSAVWSVLFKRLILSIRWDTSVISVGIEPGVSFSIFSFSSLSPKARTWFKIALALARIFFNSYSWSLSSISSISCRNISGLSHVKLKRTLLISFISEIILSLSSIITSPGVLGSSESGSMSVVRFNSRR